MAFLSVFKCPFNYIFGIPCPLCGMTRAFICLSELDFAGAFYYHPLWPLAVITLILIVINEFKIIRFNNSLINGYALFLSLCLLICFVYRHMTESPIVACHIEDSLLLVKIAGIIG